VPAVAGSTVERDAQTTVLGRQGKVFRVFARHRLPYDQVVADLEDLIAFTWAPRWIRKG
jgi:hypothetical protein